MDRIRLTRRHQLRWRRWCNSVPFWLGLRACESLLLRLCFSSCWLGGISTRWLNILDSCRCISLLLQNKCKALSTKASRQSTLGYTHGSSLSVDDAQATNSMVTQDTDKLFIQVQPPCGRNTYVLRFVVLICVERIMWPRGVPCPSLYSPEGRVTNLETNPSRLQLP